LDGPLPKWCPAVALSRQDDRHSAVALLLKAALIQVSDYRLLGASGLFHNTLAYVFFFTLLPVIKLIKDHWHGLRHISVIINETKDVYRMRP
jgi:hypothetical protein